MIKTFNPHSPVQPDPPTQKKNKTLAIFKKKEESDYHKAKTLCINSGNAPPNNDNISVSNPFDDPVAPRPYQQHTGAQYPPVSRPQGILHYFIFLCFDIFLICFSVNYSSSFPFYYHFCVDDMIC